MKQYTVVIEKKHCENADYGDNYNCPLYRAIKEQLPEFPLSSVAGDWVRDKENNLWYFNEWNISRMQEIIDEKIENYSVIFTLNEESCTQNNN